MFVELIGLLVIAGARKGMSATLCVYVCDEGDEMFQIDYYQYDSSATNQLGTYFAKGPKIKIVDYPQEIGTSTDGLTFGPILVNRDEGSEENITDWFSLCRVDELPDGSTISLFIDTSGSMTLDTVRASYDLFIAKCNEKNITINNFVTINDFCRIRFR